jgi:hypothetical protein
MPTAQRRTSQGDVLRRERDSVLRLRWPTIPATIATGVRHHDAVADRVSSMLHAPKPLQELFARHTAIAVDIDAIEYFI